ncbi:hypothetical protein LTR36_009742 [Oleoguttula mirabilis]|uniref:C3H1-type domain-containing protein n=1 Tax=Oleoguttula mirabilis TaxID=1507867 RepID=A0AAV9J580_9PEZI|nr:hypothetical protein LTR36_009742 [Oleoguttula mirabilis]
MDQLPHSNAGYDSLFPADSQQYHAYDSSFLNTTDQAFNEASWGVNASSNYPSQSRAQPALPQGWQQNANHLSANSTHGNLNGQAPPIPYGRSLSHSPAPFAQNPYGSFGNQQNFQYGQAQYDPALFNPSTTGQGFNSSYATYAGQPQTLGTIAPQALEHEARTPTTSGNIYDGMNYGQNAFGQTRAAKAPGTANIDQNALVATIPKSNDAGYLSVINFDQMVRATNSERMSNYVNIGKQTYEWPVNRPTSLPQHLPRRSKNDLRKLAGNDTVLLAKIGKKTIMKERPFTLVSNIARPLNAVHGPGSLQIRYEGDSSSSEESSDDDDDSSYTSEEDLEGSPLPNKRPDSPKEAVEYDTIKALWRPKRKAVDSASLKQGIVDFWEIVKTIRDRWKIDAAAVTEAEVKKRIGELPLLKSRVKDQRDMIESAFRAALKHGHRSVVELLGENQALVFLCYQFLLDRFKDDDLNGPLSRVTLELMTLFTTLNNLTLEKTHIVKVLPRYMKKGDAKTQFYAKRIAANAATASKEQVAAPQTSRAPSTVNASNAASPTSKRREPEPVAGIKRPSSNAGDGGAQKKLATGLAKTNGVSSVAKPGGIVKKVATSGEASRPSAAPSTSATKTKQVTAKPSSFFSSLQSVKRPGTSIKTGAPAPAAGTKQAERKAIPTTTISSNFAAKPVFSFAETMANLAKPKEQKPVAKPEKELPPETSEQKAKRLRKEARRTLHVAFKLGEELEEVRYFTHDPDEEMGHDDSQMRDVSDAGGEGRALKLHHDMMDVDADEEDDREEQEQKLVEFKPPTAIDFSEVELEERKRNYSKYGGGELVPDSAERAAREQYEADTLIVFYADAKDIPPNPREPNDPFNGSQATEGKTFGAMDAKLVARAKQRNAARPQPYYSQQQQAQPLSSNAAFDLSRYLSQQPAAQPVAQQPQATTNIDIQSILANLQQQTFPLQVQQQPHAQPIMSFGAPTPQAPSMMAPQPAPHANGQAPDLAAILASFQQPGAAQAPQMGAFGGAPGAPPMMGFTPQMMQQQQAANDAAERERMRWRDQGDKNKFFKTKVCRYWEEGRCMKGDGCTYLHEKPAA